MTEKEQVVISRHWNNPHIRVTVTNALIGIEMLLEDYITAVVEEMGNPTKLVTRAQLKKQMTAASEEVCRKMKQATTKVM